MISTVITPAPSTYISAGCARRPRSERVFERFYLSDRSRQGGTGLGLAIARHIVLAHGGQIWVEEPPTGSGACVCFTLPLAEAPSVVQTSEVETDVLRTSEV
jgi:signal transduction histidine kinase